MGSKKNGAVLCPECRKLVNAGAHICPHCGLKRPGSLFKQSSLTMGMEDAGGIVLRIIQINIAIYLFTLFLNPGGVGLGANPLGFISPSTESLLLVGATGVYPIENLGRWWSLVSANWVHGGLLHIALNMMALRQIAPLVCREYGNHRMVVIYIATGVAGFFLSYLAGVRLTIGASASVCGLVGAAFYYGKSRGGSYGRAVYRQTGGWVLSIFLFGLVVPGINNWGHGGGLIAGILLGRLLGYQEKKQEALLHRTLAGLGIFVTAVILVIAVISGFYYRFVNI